MRPIRNLTLLLILGAAPLQAQDAAGAAPAARKAPAQPQPAGLTLKEVRESFAKADADQSRSLSAEEASKAGLDAAAFSAADADADLKLSLDEFTVGSESRAAKGSAGAVFLAWAGEDDRARLVGTAEDPARLERRVLTTRRRGWAESVAERAPGVASVSAPVFGPDRALLAAVSVSGPASRLGNLRAKRYAPAVVEAAKEIERALGA